MRYVTARFQQHRREEAYRIYVTDCLKALTLNTAKFGGGEYTTQRFADMIASKPHLNDTRTAEEIVNDVLRRGGIKVIEHESI